VDDKRGRNFDHIVMRGEFSDAEAYKKLKTVELFGSEQLRNILLFTCTPPSFGDGENCMMRVLPRTDPKVDGSWGKAVWA